MKVRTTSDGMISFWCFGCGEVHAVPTIYWNWNGNYEQPTLTPSLLTTSGHYLDNWKQGDTCWCTYNAEHPDPAPFVCIRCHLFVTGGMIQYLGDCSHVYTGKTVEMKDVSEGYHK